MPISNLAALPLWLLSSMTAAEMPCWASRACLYKQKRCPDSVSWQCIPKSILTHHTYTHTHTHTTHTHTLDEFPPAHLRAPQPRLAHSGVTGPQVGLLRGIIAHVRVSVVDGVRVQALWGHSSHMGSSRIPQGAERKPAMMIVCVSILSSRACP
eukprot:scaffold156396_cov20-Tisochrysis_lutea.AAC.1